MTVNVLGVPYKIRHDNAANDHKLENCDGYCDNTIHEIIVSEPDVGVMACGDQTSIDKRITRHELIHAFCFECGLGGESRWAQNEEMVDFFARQFGKLYNLFSEAGVLPVDIKP